MTHEHIGVLSFLVVAAYVILFLIAWKMVMLRLPEDSPIRAAMAAIVT